MSSTPPLLGDHALADNVVLFQFDLPIAPTTFATLDQVCRQLRQQPGVLDAWTAYREVAIAFDHSRIDSPAIHQLLSATWQQLNPGMAKGSQREIAVTYAGPDLQHVADHAGLTPTEVAERHAGSIYVVAAIGFVPDFAYLWGLDHVIATPRRNQPRRAVPAGAVAIGGSQTAVYPQVSPGGWNLIGSCDPASVHDLHVGDQIIFYIEDVA